MREEVTDFYNGKSVVVVGGAGMVGHKLVEELANAGAVVLVIDDLSRGKNLVESDRVRYAVRHPLDDMFVEADRYSSTPAEDIPRGIPPDVYREFADARNWRAYVHFMEGAHAVFNLAATVAGVLHNEKNHFDMYASNLSLLASPLKAARAAGVEHFLQTSSVCIYAEENQCPCSEVCGFDGVPHVANAGYAEAKRDGERLLAWSNIPHGVIVRPSNIIGEMDYYDELAHVVPAFIARAFGLNEGEKFRAYGSAMIQREFIYSGDVARGMMYALALGESGEAYNIGTSGPTSDTRANTVAMLSLANKIISIVDLVRGFRRESETHVVFDNTAGGGDSLRYSDASKLRALGWQHEVGLDDALKTCVKDYMNRFVT